MFLTIWEFFSTLIAANELSFVYHYMDIFYDFDIWCEGIRWFGQKSRFRRLTWNTQQQSTNLMSLGTHFPWRLIASIPAVHYNQLLRARYLLQKNLF